MPLEYINNRYGLNAKINQEVIVNGKKGVIAKGMGGYIGVHFYDKATYEPLPCHPTWEVEYLETFNANHPIKKMTAGQIRYREYLRDDSSLTFAQWLGIKPKKKLTTLNK